MKNFALLIIILFSSAAFGQEEVNKTDSQGRKHGVWKKYYPNSQQLRYEGRFEHGVEVDTFKFYFEDGSYQAKNFFRGNGVVYSWQFGGKNLIAAEGKYVKKERDSTWTFYDIDGNVLSREDYKMGVKHGVVITYFDNGKKAELMTYVDGKREGPWNQFYETGKPKAKGQYKNDKLNGEVTYFEPNGKMGAKGTYHNGLMHGIWYYFDDNMKVEKKEEWRYGRNLTEEEERKKAKEEEEKNKEESDEESEDSE